MPVRRRLRSAVLVLLLAAGLAPALGAAASAQEVVGGWPVHRLTAAAPHLLPQPTDRPWKAQVQLTVDGRARSFSVLVPAGLPARAPLVMGLHGLYQTREGTEATMHLLHEAPTARAVVVYPSGSDASWNAGRCCGRAAAGGVDDVSFLRRVVAEVARVRPVDLSRVSAVGYSNGGMMAYRLVCDAPGLLSAIAVVGGADTTGSSCPAAVATPTMVVHGALDRVVPEAGLRSSTLLGTGVPPLAQTLAAVERRNAPAEVRTLLVRLPTEGHGWPTRTSPSGFDTTGRVLGFLLRARPAPGRAPAVRAARGR